MIFIPKTRHDLSLCLMFRKILTYSRFTKIDFLIIGGMLEWNIGFIRKKPRIEIRTTRYRTEGMLFSEICKVVNASKQAISDRLDKLIAMKILDFGLDDRYYLDLERFEPTKQEYAVAREFLYRKDPLNAVDLGEAAEKAEAEYEEECAAKVEKFPFKFMGEDLDLEGEHCHIMEAAKFDLFQAQLDLRKSQEDLNSTSSISL